MQRERLIPVRVRFDCLNRDYSNRFVYVVQFMTSGKPAKENGKLSWLRDHAQAVCAKPSETHMAQGRASDTRARALSSKHTRTCARSRAHRLSQKRANAKRAGAREQTQPQTHARTHIRAHDMHLHTHEHSRTHARAHTDEMLQHTTPSRHLCESAQVAFRCTAITVLTRTTRRSPFLFWSPRQCVVS